jgi:ATP-binding cassette subfamily B protein
MQDSVLFDTSIRENIRIGRLGASDGEVEAAARAAELDATIAALPRGWDTKVGARGASLSGGQRQRVALARALLRDPALLLLDEATSALDPATEAAIDETLSRARRGRATVAVTHRLSTAMHADRIHVLVDGAIVESGRHAELVARGGKYAELWRKQHGIVVSEDGRRAEVTPERLRAISLLSPLDEAQLAELARAFTPLAVEAGREVIREGEPGDLFYLVARGRVVVARGAGDELREIARLGDGDQFGEMALLFDKPRSATVTARTDCLFLTLTRRQFLDLIGGTPGVRDAVERIARARDSALRGAPATVA